MFVKELWRNLTVKQSKRDHVQTIDKIRIQNDIWDILDEIAEYWPRTNEIDENATNEDSYINSDEHETINPANLTFNDALVWWSFSKIGSNVWRLGHYHSSLLPNAINWLIIYQIFRMMISSMPTDWPVKINVHLVRVFSTSETWYDQILETDTIKHWILTEVIKIISVTFQYGSKDTETAVKLETGVVFIINNHSLIPKLDLTNIGTKRTKFNSNRKLADQNNRAIGPD